MSEQLGYEKLIVLRRRIKNGYEDYSKEQKSAPHGTVEWSYLEGRCDSYIVALNLFDELFPHIKQVLD